MKKQNSYIGIRDIARIAGVSTATVSRVINNPELTSEAVRNKVLAVINKYNYVPNQNAKNLFSKTSNSIAIFIYEIGNPFFISLIKDLNKVAFENKYTLLICDTENNLEKEKEYLNYCESIRTSGIILTEGLNYDIFLKNRSNQPIVFFDRTVDKRFPSVHSDSIKGMKLLVDYLYNLNHRKIAFVGGNKDFQTEIDRKQGYIDAMKNHNLSVCDEYFYIGSFDFETGVNSLDYFCSLSDRPTAIVCANDQIAKGLITRANKLNISIPDNLSVVGFDGVDSSDFLLKITTIKQNVLEISEIMFDLITNSDKTIQHKVVDVSLLIGDTCKKNVIAQK